MRQEQGGDRGIRALEGRFTQREMFGLSRRFDPKTEQIARVVHIDELLNRRDESISKSYYVNLFGDIGARTDEYRAFRYPGRMLGSEIVWTEGGISYRHLIPDVPVQFEGREISLQRTAAMAVYDSIGLLQIEQSGNNEFTVSAVDLSALAGRVRAADFMAEGYTEKWDRNEWAYGHGCLVGLRKGGNDGYNEKTTGWHGSTERALMAHNCGHSIFNVFPGWAETLRVAVVDLEPSVESGKRHT
ncbi:hypothetical protein HY988_01035 [Candidatus Micrarchaeota archaeon]|nr:hypothetical protein [Candidatus Micrarchaeota archaeon]